jgi:hypothetical protein
VTHGNKCIKPRYGLGLVKEKLKGSISEKKPTHHNKKKKEEVKRKPSQNETSEFSEDEISQKRKEDARNIIVEDVIWL